MAIGFGNPAHAAFKLSLDDSGLIGDVAGIDELITDGGVGDDSGVTGVIVFNGSIGVFTVNVTTAISKPILGDAADANLDLNSINVSTTGSGTLTIAVTDTDFLFSDTTTLITFFALLGGTTDGTVTLDVYVDDGNDEFALTTLIASLGAFGPGAFSDITSALATLTGTYSITLVATITHTGAGQVSSFDAEIEIPEPSTLLVFGIGLLSLGLVIRRRRRRVVA